MVEKYKEFIANEVLDRVQLWNEGVWEIEGKEYKKARVKGIEITRKWGIGSDTKEVVFGEMQILCDLPQGIPASIIQHWRTLEDEMIPDSGKHTVAVCNVFFTIVFWVYCDGDRKWKQDPGLLELDFGFAEYAFLELPFAAGA